MKYEIWGVCMGNGIILVPACFEKVWLFVIDIAWMLASMFFFFILSTPHASSRTIFFDGYPKSNLFFWFETCPFFE